jgi:phosphohistidine phosphatase SixA
MSSVTGWSLAWLDYLVFFEKQKGFAPLLKFINKKKRTVTKSLTKQKKVKKWLDYLVAVQDTNGWDSPEMECKTITPSRHPQTFRSTNTLCDAQESITSAMEQVSNNRFFSLISHIPIIHYNFTFLLSQLSLTIFLHYCFLTSQLIYWHLQQEEGSYI